MKFLELVKMRASVRKYTDKPVPRDAIERCLEAARLAPSACNSQPWGFIIVDDPALKNKVSDAAFSGAYSMNTFAKNAPVLIVVTRGRSSRFATIGGFFHRTQYNLIDIGIACEHFILQAAEEGIGTCWLGWFDERKAKKILGIPGNARADIMISMGYPEDGMGGEKTRKALGEINSFNVK